MYTRIFLILVSLFSVFSWAVAAPTTSDQLNVRETTISSSDANNSILESFVGPLRGFFFAPDTSTDGGVMGTFAQVAYNIKNFFILLSVLFLVIGVIKLLFSSNDEEEVKKWKRNIIWTSVGIFVMQIAYSVWYTLVLRFSSDRVGSSLGWEFWIQIFAPIVNILQTLAAFAFLFMAVWSFFIMVTGGGGEEKVKKAKNTIIYSIVGFLLIRIPYAIVKSFYGRPGCENTGSGAFTSVGACDIKEVDLKTGIGIVGKLFTYFNTFLSVICVILVIYTGWLVLISWGDEEKLKKAKHTILYIVLGFILLIASHAIFRFFILKG
jgi:Type IV secretion system pilin